MTGDSTGSLSRDDWPFPADEFVRASLLPRDEATDADARRAVARVEDGDSQ
ncbi:hypothetical protein [Halosimplex sp. J119]